MSKLNRFEMDEKGRVFVNDTKINAVTRVETKCTDPRYTEITLTFEADETSLAARSKGVPSLMDFGKALEALKKGKKVARTGWNGKGMYLFLVTGQELADGIRGNHAYLPDVTVTPVVAAIAMKTMNSIQVGWLASQTDMLAGDWVIVE